MTTGEAVQLVVDGDVIATAEDVDILLDGEVDEMRCAAIELTFEAVTDLNDGHVEVPRDTWHEFTESFSIEPREEPGPIDPDDLSKGQALVMVNDVADDMDPTYNLLNEDDLVLFVEERGPHLVVKRGRSFYRVDPEDVREADLTPPPEAVG